MIIVFLFSCSFLLWSLLLLLSQLFALFFVVPTFTAAQTKALFSQKNRSSQQLAPSQYFANHRAFKSKIFYGEIYQKSNNNIEHSHQGVRCLHASDRLDRIQEGANYHPQSCSKVCNCFHRLLRFLEGAKYHPRDFIVIFQNLPQIDLHPRCVLLQFADKLWQRRCIEDWGESRKVLPANRRTSTCPTYLKAWRGWRRAFNGYKCEPQCIYAVVALRSIVAVYRILRRYRDHRGAKRFFEAIISRTTALCLLTLNSDQCAIGNIMRRSVCRATGSFNRLSCFRSRDCQ